MKRRSQTQLCTLKYSFYESFLRCLIAMANSRIVPGQCAEYCAPSVLPKTPNPIEYSMQIKAIIIGYQVLINFIICVRKKCSAI